MSIEQYLRGPFYLLEDAWKTLPTAAYPGLGDTITVPRLSASELVEWAEKRAVLKKVYFGYRSWNFMRGEAGKTYEIKTKTIAGACRCAFTTGHADHCTCPPLYEDSAGEVQLSVQRARIDIKRVRSELAVEGFEGNTACFIALMARDRPCGAFYTLPTNDRMHTALGHPSPLYKQEEYLNVPCFHRHADERFRSLKSRYPRWWLDLWKSGHFGMKNVPESNEVIETMSYLVTVVGFREVRTPSLV